MRKHPLPPLDPENLRRLEREGQLNIIDRAIQNTADAKEQKPEDNDDGLDIPPFLRRYPTADEGGGASSAG